MTTFVLLPGFGGSTRSYDAYQQVLPQFKVIDFSKSITMADHLEAIKIQTNGLGSFSLIGISWGAIVAMIYADQQKDKVDSLILAGAGRQLVLPESLKFGMKLPFLFFCISIILFIAIFPVMIIVDRNGYRQKYGGLGVLFRLGWKQTYCAFNASLIHTKYEGKLHHDTLMLNLESDFLVDSHQLEDLVTTASGRVVSRRITPPNGSHIHVTHELDAIILSEVMAFQKQRSKKQNVL